jgi:AcrR family transcriptional regulator
MEKDLFTQRENDRLKDGCEGDLRRHILDGARHLLVRGGYQNLSMRRLARAIGYSATSIYLHFESKDDLFHALINEGMERLQARLREAAGLGESSDDASSALDPSAQLEALCRAFAHFGLENPEYYDVMFLLRPAAMERYPPEKYRRARRNLDLVQNILRRGAERGQFDAPDSLAAASALWASLHGTVSLLLARRVDVRLDADTLVEEAVRQALRGVAAAPVAASV